RACRKLARRANRLARPTPELSANCFRNFQTWRGAGARVFFAEGEQSAYSRFGIEEGRRKRRNHCATCGIGRPASGERARVVRRANQRGARSKRARATGENCDRDRRRASNLVLGISAEDLRGEACRSS